MKTKKKLKSQTKHRETRLPIGMQKTHEISKSRLPKESPTNTFSPKETGGPDADNVPDIRNPQAVQGGLEAVNEFIFHRNVPLSENF